jgi:hypothetical protein
VIILAWEKEALPTMLMDVCMQSYLFNKNNVFLAFCREKEGNITEASTKVYFEELRWHD